MRGGGLDSLYGRLTILPDAFLTSPVENPRSNAKTRGDVVMVRLVRRFAKEESGATAIEYGLIVALIAVVIVTGISALSAGLDAKFLYIANAMP
jgi:pilus assembly protein Flp/PilA